MAAYNKVVESDDIAVSVVCMTFNHRCYIEQALDSLVSQITSFKYQIIIHDDASTDGTSEIVARYAEKYANLIVPIIQEENQYSRGVALSEVIYQYVRGRYVAICEGDDWWRDPGKLQRQFDFLESHPAYSCCAHGALVYDDLKAKYIAKLQPSLIARDYSVDEIIIQNAPFATNSLFYRSSLYLRPSIFQGWGIGDYPNCIWLGTQGKFHFDPELMSVYRANAKGSWTERMRQSIQLALESDRQYVKALQAYDDYSHGAHHEALRVRIESSVIDSCIRRRDYDEIKNGPYSHRFKSYSMSKRMQIWLQCSHPSLYECMKKLFDLRRSGSIKRELRTALHE